MKMIESLRNPIQLMKAMSVDDNLGGRTRKWSKSSILWAAIKSSSSYKKDDFNGHASFVYDITFRAPTQVSFKDRLIWKSGIYEIITPSAQDVFSKWVKFKMKYIGKTLL